ncbi:MAG: ABC transporter permease [Eubacteriales bacterium]|nr:ABC transporter permease [Eubacteriales bacterium]
MLGRKKKVGKLFTVPVIAASIIISLAVVVTIFGPVIKPYDETVTDILNASQGVSAKHLLGTDSLGRDSLSRLIVGCRTTLLNSIMVVLISIMIGIPLGMLAGYYGKIFDNIYMRICDVLCAFPVLLLAFVFVGIFGRGTANVVVALGIIFTPMISKLSRSLVMVQKKLPYVQVAKVAGYSDVTILFREILPNCVGTMMAEITLDIGSAIGSLAAMSYCGLGVQPPAADWGVMLQDNMAMIHKEPLLALAPGIAIVLVVTSLSVLSDSIRVYIDPTQRVLPTIKKYKKKMGLRVFHQEGGML